VDPLRSPFPYQNALVYSTSYHVVVARNYVATRVGKPCYA